jgi:raffinose/stachyose/melibiose transport system substrate-binding protein
MTTIIAATSAMGWGMAAAQTEIADPSAPVEHQGQLVVLTKFGMQRLAPYFDTLARQYEEMHPGVTIDLIQEDDDSVKGKTKTLVASNSIPDVYFSWELHPRETRRRFDAGGRPRQRMGQDLCARRCRCIRL